MLSKLRHKFIRGFNLASRICLPDEAFLPELPSEELRIVKEVRPFTMTSPERIYALTSAVRYLSQRRLPGAIVECGVWKGGSMMAVAKTLLATGDTSRALYLFDTFEGMTKPSEKDSTQFEPDLPQAKYEQLKTDSGVCRWSYAPMEEVQKNMFSVGYPAKAIHFVKGPVEETIPGNAPESIALLRLDTDFYESTRHELIHLFPRLVQGGVIIIDDYGHWEGQRVAVEEYFRENGVNLLLVRVDYTCRVGVKV
jgi:hypothetical protein